MLHGLFTKRTVRIDMATATVIVLTAGTITFTNEWYQTRTINWRVPVATLLLAGLMDEFAKLDDKAATGLSVMILIGALLTKFGGKSAADQIAETFGQPKRKVGAA
jgi:hypothetical protein